MQRPVAQRLRAAEALVAGYNLSCRSHTILHNNQVAKSGKQHTSGEHAEASSRMVAHSTGPIGSIQAPLDHCVHAMHNKPVPESSKLHTTGVHAEAGGRMVESSRGSIGGIEGPLQESFIAPLRQSNEAVY